MRYVDWDKVSEIVRGDREIIVGELLAAARTSSDPKMQSLASKIDSLDRVLELPDVESVGVESD